MNKKSSNLFVSLVLISFHSTSLATNPYHIQVNEDLPGYRIVNASDFDKELFRQYMREKEIESYKEIYGETVIDINNDCIEDYFAFTYKVNEKPKKNGNFYFQTVYLVSCMSESKCKIIREFNYSVPIQVTLSSGLLWTDRTCYQKIYKKGTPTFDISPVLGNIWSWYAYSNGEFIQCSEGD